MNRSYRPIAVASAAMTSAGCTAFRSLARPGTASPQARTCLESNAVADANDILLIRGRASTVTEPVNVPPSEDFWRDYLEKGEPYIRIGRKVFSAIPSDPRCRLCTAPFGGLGAPFMRVIGRKPSIANPHLCTACQNALIKYHGGAEVTGTMLFADIRGSTALAERMSPVEFKTLMERFYVAASRAVIHHDGAIDKFVGDELVAIFYPALAGERHVAAAIGAASNPKVSWSLFAPQYTMSAVIANEFTEASDALYLSALVEIGMVLFIITLLVNGLSRGLIWTMARQVPSKAAA